MIPYEDLVLALTTWRARQGLPVGMMSGSLTPPRPIAFGTVPVVIAATTGVILGAKMSRSGSWTRSSSWGGG